jgi:hypothetical protein
VLLERARDGLVQGLGAFHAARPRGPAEVARHAAPRQLERPRKKALHADASPVFLHDRQADLLKDLLRRLPVARERQNEAEENVPVLQEGPHEPGRRVFHASNVGRSPGKG